MAQSLTVYNLTNPGKEFKLFTNPANAFRDYNAFQLIGTKRYSNNWQASLSYTWSHTDGTVEQHRRHELGRRQHARASARPARSPIRTTSSTPTVTRVFDYTNQVKLDGTYRVPAFGGFNVSARLPLHHRPGVGTHWRRFAG